MLKWFNIEAMSGRLEDSIDYGSVYDRIQGLMEGQGSSQVLLEVLGKRIITDLFATYPMISGIELSITKPHVAMKGYIDHGLGIQMYRKRDSTPS